MDALFRQEDIARNKKSLLFQNGLDSGVLKWSRRCALERLGEEGTLYPYGALLSLIAGYRETKTVDYSLAATHHPLIIGGNYATIHVLFARLGSCRGVLSAADATHSIFLSSGQWTSLVDCRGSSAGECGKEHALSTALRINIVLGETSASFASALVVLYLV
ncbi:hypothetical protein J6590_026811 [Homalodisca vitripennis]|nr:hypothetical protein J6590_026811 [Homalodisca vitripennis]